MEFKAIVDPKARSAAGCAVVGVYEEGDLGSGGPAHRCADRRARSAGCRRAAISPARLGDTLLLTAAGGRRAAARCCWSASGRAPAFGRKQYRRALQARAQALAKTGARRCGGVPGAGRASPTWRRSTAPAWSPRSFGAQLLPDTGSEDRREAEAAPAHARERGGRRCRARAKAAPGAAWTRRGGRRRRSRWRATWRTCRPTSARPTYPRQPRPAPGQGMAARSRPRCSMRREHQGAEDGRVSRRRRRAPRSRRG